jgi:hypothetical protein
MYLDLNLIEVKATKALLWKTKATSLRFLVAKSHI